MMVERGTRDTWIFKRDRAIFSNRSDAIWTNDDGIPFLNPAAVLLFKAKYRREKDEFDFLMKKIILMIWKIKCLEMFNVPLPLFRSGRRRARP